MWYLSRLARKTYRLVATGSTRSEPYRKYATYLQNGRGTHREGLFNLTVDLELGWSRARRGSRSTTVAESLERSRSARHVFEEFLHLSDAYMVPVTFAVVGHVAVANCASHREPPTFRPAWLGEDWFAIDPQTNLHRNPHYYGLDLVEKILSSVQKHEIASHSFSHVDLGDDDTTPEVAAFEIAESFRILRHLDHRLTTFVFPNNRPAFVNLLREAGFTIYRNRLNGELERDAAGLWKFPLGLWLSPLTCSAREVIELVDVAIHRKRLMNIWCHLYEFGSRQSLRGFFEPILRFVSGSRRRGTLEVNTMRGIVAAIQS